METKVKVTATEAGNVITVSENNPDFGYCRVEQTRMVFDDNGFVRQTHLSALVPGAIPVLKTLGWVAGQELPGKIVIKESTTPFNKRNPERDLKIAGKTGVVCVENGKPIYRNTFYNPNPDAQDVLVEHTNGEEIKAAYASVDFSSEDSNEKIMTLD